MLMLRRLRTFRHYYHYHNRRCHVTVPKIQFSSLSSPQPQSASSNTSPKPGTLSARMSFVFDQIDAIDKERAEKDQTLQRIRAWRESKRQTSPPIETSPPSLALSEQEPRLDSGKSLDIRKDEKGGNSGLLDGKREVELVHPWPEWIGLMERLVQQNYFDHKRKDEDGMMENLGFNLLEAAEEEGIDFTRDFKTVQTAVLNFGRDRFDILRSLICLFLGKPTHILLKDRELGMGVGGYACTFD